MTRVGWTVAGLFLALAAAALSVTSFGGRGAGPETPTRAPPAAAPGGALVVPVAGYPRALLRDSWGEARDGGARGHHGIDLPAPARRPVVAAAAGTVEKLFRSRLGGTTLYLRSADRRWTYYYAHLAGYAAGVREGMRVGGGQVLGFVGDTGDAGPGNYHLHFGLSRMRPDERWWQGRDVDPYPVLAGKRASR